MIDFQADGSLIQWQSSSKSCLLLVQPTGKDSGVALLSMLTLDPQRKENNSVNKYMDRLVNLLINSPVWSGRNADISADINNKLLNGNIEINKNRKFDYLADYCEIFKQINKCLNVFRFDQEIQINVAVNLITRFLISDGWHIENQAQSRSDESNQTWRFAKKNGMTFQLGLINKDGQSRIVLLTSETR